jgi:hypothetical protein
MRFKELATAAKKAKQKLTARISPAKVLHSTDMEGTRSYYAL